MRARYLLIALLLVFVVPCCKGQMNLNDTAREYNKHRILTNVRGLNTLAVWGLANVGIGGAGYFTAKNDELKYFHGMNAAWGVVNTGVAAIGLLGAQRQALQRPNLRTCYNLYRRDNRTLLISAGFDIAVIAGGVYMVQQESKEHNNPEQLRGFGKSFVLQGVGLLVFDNIMLLSHSRYSGRWATMLDELKFTGGGFSYVHTF